MRALVTGAAGFIGSYLCERLLRDGWQVLGVDCFSDSYPRRIKERNLRPSLEHPAFRFEELDLAVGEIGPLVEDQDCVFHLAARAGVRSSWGSSFDAYLHDNLLATQRLLEAARDRRLSRFVYGSSSSVYGDAACYPTPETTTPLPIAPYGLTKLAAEQLCGVYWRSYGLPVVSLRFFTVYGPRQRPDMAFHLFCRAAVDGARLRVLGDGSQRREFTYVDDIVEALVLSASRGEPGEAYNVGGGSEASINDALAVLREVSDRDLDVVYEPTAVGDSRRTSADMRKTQRHLGFAPATGLVEGLRREYEWLRDLAEADGAVGALEVAGPKETGRRP